MKIEITARGIYDNAGEEIPVGTELTLKDEPTDWVGRYRVVGGDVSGKTAVTNPAKSDKTGLRAEHRGGGSYSIMDGDKEIVEKLSKAEAEEFNALDAEARAKFIEKPAEV